MDNEYAPIPPAELSPKTNARQAWQDGYHEAARKYANPDYEAATAAYQRMIEWDMEGADWNYEEYAHNIVDAALGLTEAPDGQ